MSYSTDFHRDYIAMQKIWERCRHAKAGEDAVKLKGEVYLPRLGGQTDEQYNAYKTRARFFNAFNKTITGHVGLAMRKPILITVPEAMEKINDNIDRNGADVSAYVKAILTELLEVGRVISLIDYTKLDAEATMLDAETARPYWIQYKAEEFIDWEYTEDGVLIYGVFRETEEQRGAHHHQKYRYRVVELIDGVYTQSIFIEDSSDPVEVVTPRIAGKTLDFIPVIIHQTDYDTSVDLPPLLDLVNLCMSHYRLKADQMHALHYVALPTPYIIGVDPTDEDFPDTIGPHKVWGITAPDAKVGMLEFTGAGVEAIDRELKSMEDQMAIIGARVLLPEVSENTATASNLRSISETSDLVSIVTILSRQVQMMLEFTALWGNMSGEVELQMSTHFLPAELDASMVTALVGAWQNGGFDYDTLIDNFKRAEIVDPEKTVEELQASTEQEGEARMQKAAEAMAAMETAGGGPDEDEEEDEG
ncbi:MAG: DUF4055 domain-containing protein [Gammaproteobacteria bacterium]|nr:DUF4055 domain-containing protein [Gammaproteobacteria bacterium]